MSLNQNQQTIGVYMDGFRKNDRAQILSCLTDDVEWVLPGVFHVHGKEEFNNHIVDEGFVPPPEIMVTRLLEDNDIVMAEGSVRAPRTDGTILNLVFCDVFEMRDARIRKLTSYLMEIK